MTHTRRTLLALALMASAWAVQAQQGPVKIASKDSDKGGSSKANVTNWVTAGAEGGIQIEQSKKVREQHWKTVANAVANVYSGLI